MKEYILEHALEIKNDYEDAKLIFNGMDYEKAAKILSKRLIKGADLIRDDKEKMDINFGCLCITIYNCNNVCDLGEVAEVYDSDGNIVASSLTCTTQLDGILKDKLIKNVLFIKNVLHKQGCPSEIKEMDSLSEEIIRLVASL